MSLYYAFSQHFHLQSYLAASYERHGHERERRSISHAAAAVV
jgi:hypothetical protein